MAPVEGQPRAPRSRRKSWVAGIARFLRSADARLPTIRNWTRVRGCSETDKKGDSGLREDIPATRKRATNAYGVLSEQAKRLLPFRRALIHFTGLLSRQAIGLLPNSRVEIRTQPTITLSSLILRIPYSHLKELWGLKFAVACS